MTQKIFHFVSAGKVPESISKAVRDLVAALQGKRLVLTLEEYKNKSTDPQRRYYFAVIVRCYLEAFQEAGNEMDSDDMHIWLKTEIGHLWKEVITPEGEVTKILRSYLDLTTMETEVYHTKCRARAAEFGIDIPEPNE